MAIPFILHSPSLLQGVNLTFEGDDSLLWLLLRELRDYSLGQIAFSIFQGLLAITQLLFQVNVMLTSACKQA